MLNKDHINISAVITKNLISKKLCLTQGSNLTGWRKYKKF